MNDYEGLQYLTGFIAKTGSAMGEAESIINYYAKDQAAALKMVNGTLTKMASCRTVDGEPILPEGLEKEAADYLSTHAGAVSVAYQLAEKVAELNEALDNGGTAKKASYDLGDVVPSTGKTKHNSDISSELAEFNAKYDAITSGYNSYNL